jgi:hypothetical protein
MALRTASSPPSRRPGQQVGRDDDVAGLGQLIGHAARPIGQAKYFVNENDRGRLVFDFGIGNEAIDLAIAVLDFHPLQVARGFIETRPGPILSGCGDCRQRRGNEKNE